MSAPHCSVPAMLRDLPVEIVDNPNAACGMLSSVQAGLRALGGQDNALIGLCDQPSLAPETIQRIVMLQQRTGKGIIIPTHCGRGGHPILVCKRFFGEILSLPTSRTLKDFVRAHAREVLRMEVTDRGVTQDIDDWATYQREKAR